MARGNPGRIWKVKETEQLAFSYNKEQQPEFAKLNKVLVYVSQVVQPTLFSDIPPKEQCQRVLKSMDKLKLIGYMD